jgi:hypothetical protein
VQAEDENMTPALVEQVEEALAILGVTHANSEEAEEE